MKIVLVGKIVMNTVDVLFYSEVIASFKVPYAYRIPIFNKF
jgi:hypothetical protein